MTHPNDPPIRDAATLIVLRDTDEGVKVLMGQRGANAVFMPNKYVFPGGALDATDCDLPLASALQSHVADKLRARCDVDLAEPLALAAVRELFEETGLILGAPGAPANVPADWHGFYQLGARPDLARLEFVFRAVTPTGRSRRFDARFFMVTADAVLGDLDDFSRACDELSHLHWIGLRAARSLELPFITEVVLAEVEARLASKGPRPVPFFNHDAARSYFHAL